MFPRLLFAILALFFSFKGRSQSIAAYVAKDKKTSSHLKYYIVWGCSQADKAARDSLKKQGYTEISNICYKSIEKGFFTVVYGSTPNDDGSIRETYGIGVDTTQELSLKSAIESLSGNNWSWSQKKHGYKIIEEKDFEACKKNGLMCVLDFEKNGACGKTLKSYKINRQITTKRFTSFSDPRLKFFEIGNNHDEVALLEMVYLCSPDKSTFSEVKLISATGEKNLEILIAEAIFNVQTSKTGLTAVNILFKSTGESVQTGDKSITGSMIGSIKKLIREYLDDYCKKNKCDPALKTKSVGIGVRG